MAHAGARVTPIKNTWLRSRPGVRSGICCREGRSESLENAGERHAHDGAHHGEGETEVEGDRADSQGGYEPTKEAHRRIGERVHHFDENKRESLRAPGSIHPANEVDDESTPEHEEVQEKNKVQEVSD